MGFSEPMFLHDKDGQRFAQWVEAFFTSPSSMSIMELPEHGDSLVGPCV
jgi:hypothetical protein